MPLVLSNSASSTMEPIKKNRWIMQFSDIPGSSGKQEKLALVAVTASAPTLSYNATEYHRLNERFYTAGKPTWSEIPMTFYDFISGTDSAGDILYKWSTSIYNPLTGEMHWKSKFTTTGTLALLDPLGQPTRIWNLYHLWPMNVNFGDGLDAASEELQLISVTFRYDFAVKQDDIAVVAG